MDGVDKQGEEGEVMTVIYVDTLFLLNALVDYLLLLCAARLAGEPLKRLRFALGAVLGGGYAVAIFLPGLGFLERPACRLSAAVLMVLAAFWGSRRLGRQVLIFFCPVLRLCRRGVGHLHAGRPGAEPEPGSYLLGDGSEDRAAVGSRVLRGAVAAAPKGCKAY